MSTFAPDILEGKVALVTGGGTGIGKEIARTLASHGARLCIAARRQEVLEATREEFESEGHTCLAVPCDVRRPEQVEVVMRETLTRFGRLDIVINNAAGNFPAPMAGISYNGFKSIVDIDLLGTYNVSKAAYDAWLGEHGGNIVNITAPFEQMGPAYQAHVAAAKTGVNSLTLAILPTRDRRREPSYHSLPLLTASYLPLQRDPTLALTTHILVPSPKGEPHRRGPSRVE